MNTRTNIVLDDALIAQAMLRARVTTKKAAVEAALRAYTQKPDYSALLALQGRGALSDDYNPDEAYLNGWEGSQEIADNTRQATLGSKSLAAQRIRRKSKALA